MITDEYLKAFREWCEEYDLNGGLLPSGLKAIDILLIVDALQCERVQTAKLVAALDSIKQNIKGSTFDAQSIAEDALRDASAGEEK